MDPMTVCTIRGHGSKGSLGTGNEPNQKTGRHLDRVCKWKIVPELNSEYQKIFENLKFLTFHDINILMSNGISNFSPFII